MEFYLENGLSYVQILNITVWLCCKWLESGTGAPRSQERAPSSRATTGPCAASYCRVQGGRCFLWARCPCSQRSEDTPRMRG